MRLRTTIVAISLIAAGVAHASRVEASPALAQTLADTASGFCIDILSHKTAVPAPGSKTYMLHGLMEGVPQEAMAALGRDGISLIARATLASAKANDGAFVVALGGAAGETCRLIVFKAPAGGGSLQSATLAQMTAKLAGWHSLPTPAANQVMRKLSAIKRDASGKPYIANLLSPVAANPISLVVVVAAIPPNVTLPQGY